MKILILSNNPVSTTANNGKTIASIISVLGDHDFAQIYFDSDMPETNLPLVHVSLTDKKVLGLFIRKFNPKGWGSSENSFDIQASGVLSSASRYKVELYRLAREILWFLPLGHKKELIDFAVDFRPDILFFVAGDFIFANRLAIELQKKTGSQMVTFFTDDYMFIKHDWNILGHFRSFLISRFIKKVVALSSNYLTISPSMKVRYDRFFDKTSVIAFNIVEQVLDAKCEPLDALRSDKVTIVYAGGLHLDRLSSIEILARHVETLHDDVSIKIFSSDSRDIEVQKRLSCFKTVELLAPVSPDSLVVILQDADILLHVESFDPYYSSRTRYSLSTKIPEYLSFGKPLLAIGPQLVGSIKHLQGAAVCITEPEVDIAKANKLIQSKDYRTALGKLSAEKFKKDHNKKHLTKTIRAAFFNNHSQGEGEGVL